MRVVKRDLTKIEFDRVTSPIFLTKYMDEIVQWNTDQMAIMEKSTIPMKVVLTPDEWSIIARQGLKEDAWLV